MPAHTWRTGGSDELAREELFESVSLLMGWQSLCLSIYLLSVCRLSVGSGSGSVSGRSWSVERRARIWTKK